MGIPGEKIVIFPIGFELGLTDSKPSKNYQKPN